MLPLGDLNWLSIIIATVGAFAVGGIWFGPKTFYPAWIRAMGHTMENPPSNDTSPAILFGLTALGAFVQATALAVIIEYISRSEATFGLVQGALTGLWVGIGLAAAASLSHRVFAGHGLKVWVIEVGGDVAGLIVMGAVIGAFL